MALAGNVGALINKPMVGGETGLFAEDQGLYVATICDNCLLTFLARAHAAGVEVEAIGRTCGTRLIFELPGGDHAVPLADLREAHESFFPKLMANELGAA
jgi:phosphoribosylformylglycinamidine synthase